MNTFLCHKNLYFTNFNELRLRYLASLTLIGVIATTPLSIILFPVLILTNIIWPIPFVILVFLIQSIFLTSVIDSKKSISLLKYVGKINKKYSQGKAINYLHTLYKPETILKKLDTVEKDDNANKISFKRLIECRMLIKSPHFPFFHIMPCWLVNIEKTYAYIVLPESNHNNIFVGKVPNWALILKGGKNEEIN